MKHHHNMFFSHNYYNSEILSHHFSNVNDKGKNFKPMRVQKRCFSRSVSCLYDAFTIFLTSFPPLHLYTF